MRPPDAAKTSGKPIKKLSYRADIDGLRAFAVLAVIAAHLPEKFLPSGFLGVDVFFAISGFVVTASLMSQKRTQLPQLYIGFLARRVKRLLPALAVCVTMTSFLVLATDPFPRHSIQTGLAALFGFANIVLFFFELDYFSPSAVFNAFTHTWSLGVEEQFYVVFPMFAWLFFFRTNTGSFKPLAMAMIIGGLVSVTSFVLLYENHQPAAFFLMPMRIWELGVGALVFLVSRRMDSEHIHAVLGRLSPFVLVALLLCFMIPEEHAMPVTLLAVALTGLLLAGDGQSRAASLLKLPPVVYIGRISYSLYLWHWPVIALGPIVLTAAWRSSAFYVVVMLLAAVLSFHLVEKPLRYRTWTSRRIYDIGLGVAGNLVLALVLIVSVSQASSSPQSTTDTIYPPAYLPILHNGKSHQRTCALDGGSRVFRDDTVENCTVPHQPGLPTIWAMGDSHSGHLQGMLFEIHERLGLGVHLVETPGWSFPLPAGRMFEPRMQVFKSISERFRAGDIVLVSRMFFTKTLPYEVKELRPWLHNTGRLADELSEMGVWLVITGPPPIFPFDDIRECKLEDRDACRLERASMDPLVREVLDQLTRLETSRDNIVVFDVFNNVCPDDDTYCYPDNGSSYLYRDKDHFNSLGSRMLAEAFVETLRSNGVLTLRQ